MWGLRCLTRARSIAPRGGYARISRIRRATASEHCGVCCNIAVVHATANPNSPVRPLHLGAEFTKPPRERLALAVPRTGGTRHHQVVTQPRPQPLEVRVGRARVGEEVVFDTSSRGFISAPHSLREDLPGGAYGTQEGLYTARLTNPEKVASHFRELIVDSFDSSSLPPWGGDRSDQL